MQRMTPIHIIISKIRADPMLGLVATMGINKTGYVDVGLGQSVKVTSKDRMHQITLKVEHMVKLTEGAIA